MSTTKKDRALIQEWRQLQAPCKGCFYQRGLTRASPNYGPTCDYLLLTGSRRPCPPGAGCRVKVNRRGR